MEFHTVQRAFSIPELLQELLAGDFDPCLWFTKKDKKISLAISQHRNNIIWCLLQFSVRTEPSQQSVRRATRRSYKLGDGFQIALPFSSRNVLEVFVVSSCSVTLILIFSANPMLISNMLSVIVRPQVEFRGSLPWRYRTLWKVSIWCHWDRLGHALFRIFSLHVDGQKVRMRYMKLVLNTRLPPRSGILVSICAVLPFA